MVSIWINTSYFSAIEGVGLTFIALMPFVLIATLMYVILNGTARTITKNDTKLYAKRSITIIVLLLLLICFLAYKSITTNIEIKRQQKLSNSIKSQ